MNILSFMWLYHTFKIYQSDSKLKLRNNGGKTYMGIRNYIHTWGDQINQINYSVNRISNIHWNWTRWQQLCILICNEDMKLDFELVLPSLLLPRYHSCYPTHKPDPNLPTQFKPHLLIWLDAFNFNQVNKCIMFGLSLHMLPTVTNPNWAQACARFYSCAIKAKFLLWFNNI